MRPYLKHFCGAKVVASSETPDILVSTDCDAMGIEHFVIDLFHSKDNVQRSLSIDNTEILCNFLGRSIGSL